MNDTSGKHICFVTNTCVKFKFRYENEPSHGCIKGENGASAPSIKICSHVGGGRIKVFLVDQEKEIIHPHYLRNKDGEKKTVWDYDIVNGTEFELKLSILVQPKGKMQDARIAELVEQQVETPDLTAVELRNKYSSKKLRMKCRLCVKFFMPNKFGELEEVDRIFSNVIENYAPKKKEENADPNIVCTDESIHSPVSQIFGGLGTNGMLEQFLHYTHIFTSSYKQTLEHAEVLNAHIRVMGEQGIHNPIEYVKDLIFCDTNGMIQENTSAPIAVDLNTITATNTFSPDVSETKDAVYAIGGEFGPYMEHVPIDTKVIEQEQRPPDDFEWILRPSSTLDSKAVVANDLFDDLLKDETFKNEPTILEDQLAHSNKNLEPTNFSPPPSSVNFSKNIALKTNTDRQTVTEPSLSLKHMKNSSVVKRMHPEYSEANEVAKKRRQYSNEQHNFPD